MSEPRQASGLQGPWRRVIYVTIYEIIAIIASSLLFVVIGQQPGESGAMAVVASAVAVIWNVGFNSAFEWWEARQSVKGRSLGRRVAHAIGFEGGLALILVPLMAWWFGVTLWQALVMEAALVVFFLVYTYLFNWVFDHFFGLPASAQTLA
ncbi:MAG: PACE efflux transporter [Comamonas sp.]|nr:PACE efflux transporter [Comamonas sp.]